MTTPVLLGKNQSAANSATLAITTTADSPAGAAIVIGASNSGSTPVGSVADSAGNTYVQKTSTIAQLPSSVWVANNDGNSGQTAHLPSGGTITVTFTSANTNVKVAIAGSAPGYNASDIAATPTSNAGSTAPSIASGTLAQATEVIFVLISTGSAGGTPTGVTNMTSLGSEQGTGAEWVTLGYHVVSATTSVTSSATIVSAKWNCLLISMKLLSDTGTGSTAFRKLSHGGSGTVTSSSGPAPVLPSGYSLGAGLAGDVSCEMLDTSLASLGLVEILTLTATLFYNQVGTWAATCAFSNDLWNTIKTAIADGGFNLEFNWGNQFKFGGRCEIPGYQDSIPGASNAAVFTTGKMIVFSGATWEYLIANRLAFPDPTVAWASQSLSATDVQTSVAQETAIKHFVTGNTGAAATTLRKIPFLTVATTASRGSTISYTVKFGQGADLGLMDVIRNIVALGNPMGVKIDRDGDGLTFDCYIPADLTDIAYFSEALGNLVSVGLQLEDPKATDACVVGSAALIEETGAGFDNPWTRIEVLVDQSGSSDGSQNAQAGRQAITDGAITPTLSISATDIPRLQFGKDYFLGDKVTVEVTDGDEFADIVSQVDLNYDASQDPPVSVVPTIGFNADTGSMTPSLTSQLVARIRRIERRLDTQIGS